MEMKFLTNTKSKKMSTNKQNADSNSDLITVDMLRGVRVTDPLYKKVLKMDPIPEDIYYSIICPAQRIQDYPYPILVPDSQKETFALVEQQKEAVHFTDEVAGTMDPNLIFDVILPLLRLQLSTPED